MEYTTESGYTVRETLSGLDVEDCNGCHACELPVGLSHFEDENGNIDEDLLEAEIRNEMDIEGFLADQADYA